MSNAFQALQLAQKNTEDECASIARRQLDARAVIDKLKAEIASVESQLAGLDDVVANDRLEALITSKDSPNTLDASSKKSQQRAALQERGATLRRDIKLLEDETVRCNAREMELSAILQDLAVQIRQVLLAQRVARFNEAAVKFFVEEIMPLEALRIVLNKQAPGSANLLLNHLELSRLVEGIPQILYKNGVGALFNQISNNAFNLDRYPAMVDAMVADAVAAE
jgi:hypothetical protein